NLVVHDLNVGILFITSITSVCVLGIFMAGWGSNNKYSLLGGMRSAAQIISYEVPLLLSIVLVIMETGTLSMQEIVQAQQHGWFILKPNLALAFLVYLISATAEVNRVPFDIPEAESELGAGYHTEYSGMKFAMFFVSEYTNFFIVSAIAATLFLGGWQGPILPSVVWFLLKSYGIVFLLMWVRWTLPRVRMDQMMSFAWKVLTPVALLNLLISGWWMVK
ncbi:MAG: NADH-quinone oxidoreductase subunit H, partial [Omnitrophica WOR_2 bacterium GWA2_47_8]